MIKTTAKAALVMTVVAGFALVSLASQAKTQAHIHQIDLEGETITISCADDKVNDIWVEYARCLEIFDEDYEQEIAETYCKPLAVAQACSAKNVPSI